MPAPERFAERPHGTRLRYVSGCRCVPCRAANSRYETERLAARKAGDWRGVVDAAPAVAHIRRLGRAGVGNRSVAAAAGLARGTVVGLLSGRRARIRAHHLARILAVTADARADGSYVPAGPTWTLVRGLLEEGYTKGRIAQEIGARTPKLQLGRRRVLAGTALRIEKLYRRLME